MDYTVIDEIDLENAPPTHSNIMFSPNGQRGVGQQQRHGKQLSMAMGSNSLNSPSKLVSSVHQPIKTNITAPPPQAAHHQRMHTRTSVIGGGGGMHNNGGSVDFSSPYSGPGTRRGSTFQPMHSPMFTRGGGGHNHRLSKQLFSPTGLQEDATPFPNFLMIHGQVQELLSVCFEQDLLTKEDALELDKLTCMMFQKYAHLVVEMQRPVQYREKPRVTNMLRDVNLNATLTGTMNRQLINEAVESEDEYSEENDRSIQNATKTTAELLMGAAGKKNDKNLKNKNQRSPLPSNVTYSIPNSSEKAANQPLSPFAQLGSSTTTTGGDQQQPIEGEPKKFKSLRKSFKLNGIESVEHDADMVEIEEMFGEGNDGDELDFDTNGINGGSDGTTANNGARNPSSSSNHSRTNSNNNGGRSHHKHARASQIQMVPQEHDNVMEVSQLENNLNIFPGAKKSNKYRVSSGIGKNEMKMIHSPIVDEQMVDSEDPVQYPASTSSSTTPANTRPHHKQREASYARPVESAHTRGESKRLSYHMVDLQQEEEDEMEERKNADEKTKNNKHKKQRLTPGTDVVVLTRSPAASKKPAVATTSVKVNAIAEEDVDADTAVLNALMQEAEEEDAARENEMEKEKRHAKHLADEAVKIVEDKLNRVNGVVSPTAVKQPITNSSTSSLIISPTAVSTKPSSKVATVSSPTTLHSLHTQINELQSIKSSLESEITQYTHANHKMITYIRTLRHRFMQRSFLVIKFHQAWKRLHDGGKGKWDAASLLANEKERRYFALSLDGTQLWWSKFSTLQKPSCMNLVEIYDVKVMVIGVNGGGKNSSSRLHQSSSFSLHELMLSCHHASGGSSLKYDPVTDEFEFPEQMSTSDLFQIRRELYKRVLVSLKESLTQAGIHDDSIGAYQSHRELRRQYEDGEEASSRGGFMTPPRMTQHAGVLTTKSPYGSSVVSPSQHHGADDATSSSSPTHAFFPSPLRAFHSVHWRISFCSSSRDLDLLFQTKSDLDIWIEFMQRIWTMKQERKMEEQARVWKEKNVR